ncbi:conserved Plasmodium protein, unknown function [Plasmodium ovale curtisi]|uniref:Uncharacterized protein n=1 Tax=Plasmodium ovale curtisi TaxID=864141 RepID=A0A1A8W934_PLAOA|nr:conserved Plasmodium protein, unknown function [Plasmodium ovale curtisi]SBT01626.1 conserved Plasmodium protein, unknown function [Plasmodium ovale curtisi]
MNLFDSNSQKSSSSDIFKKHVKVRKKKAKKRFILSSNSECELNTRAKGKIIKEEHLRRKNPPIDYTSCSNGSFERCRIKKESERPKRRKLKRNYLFSSSSAGSRHTDSGGNAEKGKNRKKRKKQVKKRCPFNSSSGGKSEGKRTSPERLNKCLFSSSSGGGSTGKHISPERMSICLFSNNTGEGHCVGEGRKEKYIPPKRISNRLFNSNSERSESTMISDKDHESGSTVVEKMSVCRMSNRSNENGTSFNGASRKGSPFNRKKKSYRDYKLREGEKHENDLFADDMSEGYATNDEDNSSCKKEYDHELKKYNIIGEEMGGSTWENYNHTMEDKKGEDNLIRRKKVLNKQYDRADTFCERKRTNLYRIINFEKMKKRASRKLNFLSIVDMTKGDSESGEDVEENTNCNDDDKKNKNVSNPEEDSEDDILNQTDMSDTKSEESLFSYGGETSVKGGKKRMNSTLDIYNYYFMENDPPALGNENVERIVHDDSDCSRKNNALYSCLFNVEDETGLEDDNVVKSSEKGSKKGKKEKNRKAREKKKFSLKNNFILYRNFKNINNEISRQDNLKGLNFREMVSSFIRVVNKNVLIMNQRGNYNKCIRGGNTYKGLDDTSEVEEGFLSTPVRSNRDWSSHQSSQDKIDHNQSGLNRNDHNQSDRNQGATLRKAECVCHFCAESGKILSKEELDLTLFRYIEENKTENTIIKAFFMNTYIFKCFINRCIHYKTITIVCKLKNVSKLKTSIYYKCDEYIRKKYNISKIIYFIANKVILTTIGLCMYGSNYLNMTEKLIVVISFLKWKKIKKNYFEILKLKRGKEDMMICKKISFLINAIDKFCSIRNIHLDVVHRNGRKRSKDREIGLSYVRTFGPSSIEQSVTGLPATGPSAISGHPYNEERVNEIEKILNVDLENYNLHLLLMDPLHVASRETFHVYPSHVLLLF